MTRLDHTIRNFLTYSVQFRTYPHIWVILRWTDGLACLNFGQLGDSAYNILGKLRPIVFFFTRALCGIRTHVPRFISLHFIFIANNKYSKAKRSNLLTVVVAQSVVR